MRGMGWNCPVSIQSRCAFTLIELLIVVAIVAILSAIAIPNFLEAQTRSKVSRVRADLRTLASGLEAYRVDHNAYPPPTGNGIPSRLWRLSSPVVYMSLGRLDDAFKDVRAGELIDHELEYWGGNDRRTALSSSANGTLTASRLGGGVPRVMWYFLRSAGPDNDVNAGGASWETWTERDDLVDYLYDPTNGTLSFGEIMRVGGEPVSLFIDCYALVNSSR